MNKELTEIAYILDRSGSMAHLTEAAISGFNHFLKTQQENDGKAKLSLILFDDEYILQNDSENIQHVRPLDATTYIPRGSTALLDAIGRTIHNIGKRLASLHPNERPGKVIICIFTDGYENASTDYTAAQIRQTIQYQREKYNWEIYFLSATEDALQTAMEYGINQNDASMIYNTAKGMESSAAAFSRKTTATRNFQRGAATAQNLQDLDAQFSQIYTEEHSKEYGI